MILVTGATGLVGSHLTYQLLQKGLPVKAVKRTSSNIQNTLKVFSYYSTEAKTLFNKIEWVEADLMDVDEVAHLLTGVDEVYHCAAMVSFAHKDKKKLVKYNPGITANLVNAALRGAVSKFCLVSSVAVLDKSGDEPTAEKDYWKNDPDVSTYGISKYMCEMEVWRGIEEGLNAVIVNPSLILGPGNWNASSSTLFKAAYNGLPFYSPGTNGFVDVQDVASIMISLMEKELFGQRYVLNAENWTFKKFFDFMASQLQVKAAKKVLPKRLSSIFWRFEWIRSFIFGNQPILTKETTQSAFSHTRFNNQKIKETLNFNFIPVEESIKMYAGFYLDDLRTAKNS